MATEWVHVIAGVSRQTLFRTLYLLSTKMLMDLPQIWSYKYPYLASVV